jgi:hypothetical protein
VNHKVGDLVIRHYLHKPILGILKKINKENLFRYEIEWIHPADGCATSSYGEHGIADLKERLNEFLSQRG